MTNEQIAKAAGDFLFGVDNKNGEVAIYDIINRILIPEGTKVSAKGFAKALQEHLDLQDEIEAQ
ncbi:hypothetical protein ACI2JA_03380 [Alkalihalobacillus sp. NPDC078783]